MKLLILLLTSFFFFSPKSNNIQNIEVTVTGIRSAKGKLLIGLYKDDQSFQKETAAQMFQFEKTGLKNGELTVQLKVEKGSTGLSLLDDENDDGEMHYNFIGMPKEGFGFSNYYHKGFTKPTFDDFDFELEEDGKRVEIKIRYIL